MKRSIRQDLSRIVRPKSKEWLDRAIEIVLAEKRKPKPLTKGWIDRVIWTLHHGTDNQREIAIAKVNAQLDALGKPTAEEVMSSIVQKLNKPETK